MLKSRYNWVIAFFLLLASIFVTQANASVSEIIPAKTLMDLFNRPVHVPDYHSGNYIIECLNNHRINPNYITKTIFLNPYTPQKNKYKQPPSVRITTTTNADSLQNPPPPTHQQLPQPQLMRRQLHQ